MNKLIAGAFGLCFSLSACVGGGVGAGAGVGAVLGPAVAAQIGVSAATLSEIAAAACATQKVANVAAEVATQRGSPLWAQRFSEASAVTGLGCAW